MNSTTANLKAREQQCIAEDYAHPNGPVDKPLVSNATMEWTDTLLSSIATATEGRHTIAFLGTALGKLLKVGS